MSTPRPTAAKNTALKLACVGALSLMLTGRVHAQTAGSETLTSIGDARLMNELADRNLNSLLDRYFETHNVPTAQRDALKAMQALRQLSADPKISNAEKTAKIKQIVAGIDVALPSLHDPVSLAKDAATLLDLGVTRDVNLLEYWGDNPATQARLKPVAQAVYKMLGQAAKDAQARADALASKITPSNQETLGAQWDQLDKLQHDAQYSQNMTAYDVALAMPLAERAAFVEPAMAYLTDLDTPDSQVQPRVRLMLGKLNLVIGRFDDAIRILDTVSADDKIAPPPTPDQKYEAQYFKLVALMQAGKVKDAQDGIDGLVKFGQTAMPKDDVTQKQISAAVEMLRYRVLTAQANALTDPVAKENADKAAADVLLKLSEQRQELRGIIFQQLVERMPKDAPIKGMDPLLLQGVMAKAYDESSKPAGAVMDRAVLQRGLDATAEIDSRRGQPGVTPELIDQAARLTPVLMEAMGNKIEAAKLYLKYAQENAVGHSQNAQGSLDDAGRLVFELRRTIGDNPIVAELYDQFLPLALNPPFNHKELAFLYAQRLRLQNKPLDAMKYYALVDRKDKNYPSAQYFTLFAMQNLLEDPKLPDQQRILTAQQLVTQSRRVRDLYAGSTDPAGRERAADATLLEARTAGADLHNPRQTLKSLEGFDAAIAGLPREKSLASDAALTRVNAYMAMGQLKNATDSLVTLLNTTGGSQGADYVRGLLDRLDASLEMAQASHDATASRDIAKSESDLSGFLVEWAKNSPVPEINGYTYRYMVFDARTKRLAGTLNSDPAERTRLLNIALDAYKKLESADNVKLYRATLDPKRVAAGDIDPQQPDPNVQLGIALTDFELGNYRESSEFLGTLLNTGKLGGPTLLVDDPATHEQKVIDNDVYWQATSELYRSNAELGKDPSTGVSLDATRQGLKNLLIRGGIPDKWAPDFESLRSHLVPDFTVEGLTSTTMPAASAPATQPAHLH